MLSDPAVRRHAETGRRPELLAQLRAPRQRRGSRRGSSRLFDRVISSGRRTTIRELWILTARLLFGASEDAEDEVPDAPPAWYSERLFAPDARFPLIEALRGLADPAGVSHPHVDRRLEDSDGTRAGQWLAGSELPPLLPSPVAALGLRSEDRERYRTRFLALETAVLLRACGGRRQRLQARPRVTCPLPRAAADSRGRLGALEGADRGCQPLLLS